MDCQQYGNYSYYVIVLTSIQDSEPDTYEVCIVMPWCPCRYNNDEVCAVFMQCRSSPGQSPRRLMLGFMMCTMLCVVFMYCYSVQYGVTIIVKYVLYLCIVFDSQDKVLDGWCWASWCAPCSYPCGSATPPPRRWWSLLRRLSWLSSSQRLAQYGVSTSPKYKR